VPPDRRATAPVTDLSDDALRTLLIGDPERGWRAFIDQCSPTLVALIERAGAADRDAVNEIYVRVCERLAADDCRRLRRFDPAKGSLAAWLTIVVRHALVDWVRSRAGLRRLFGAVERLARFDQRVFALYYWDRLRVAEIVVELRREAPGEAIGTARVLDALARIDAALSDRQRRELLSQLARVRVSRGFDELEEGRDVATGDDDPERATASRELDARFASALASLPDEDAAILRLTFVQGWSRSVVQRALHLVELTDERLQGILRALRERLAADGIGAAEAATPGLRFLEDEPT
jgi:DNA-directed RNA polymerase specialized sigma24 family protein